MRLSILLFIAILFLVSASVSFAQSMQNEDHLLELNPLDDTSQTISPIQTTASPIPQPNNSKRLRPLIAPKQKTVSININSDLLSFGIISPTSPSDRNLKISLSGTALIQQLYVARENQLSNGSKGIINDTSCDTGTCSQFIASDWINTLTFGYGYSCKAVSCEDDFAENRFRPFAPVLTSVYEVPGTEAAHELDFPVRINIPGTQEKGTYETPITILSVSGL